MQERDIPERQPPSSKGAVRERKFVRYRVGLFCQFSSDHRSGEGKVIDLSTGGCKIESESPLPSGEYVGLTFPSLVPDRPIGVELAVVRWSREQTFGAEFIRLDAVHQERLRLLLHYIEKDAAM